MEERITTMPPSLASSAAGMRRALPYVAEAGRAGFAGLAAFTAVAAVLEFLSPGFVVDYVSPQWLIAFAAALAALSLLSPQPHAATTRQKGKWAKLRWFAGRPVVQSLAAAAIVAAIAFNYFAGQVDKPALLASASAAIAFAAMLVFTPRKPYHSPHD